MGSEQHDFEPKSGPSITKMPSWKRRGTTYLSEEVPEIFCCDISLHLWPVTDITSSSGHFAISQNRLIALSNDKNSAKQKKGWGEKLVLKFSVGLIINQPKLVDITASWNCDQKLHHLAKLKQIYVLILINQCYLD